jgi:hypothetical protein
MKCGVKECQKDAWEKGLCTMHYSRLRKQGTLEQTRPKDWGNRKKHPLYNAWRELVRKKEKSRAEVWDDFWKFVADVGERPSAEHALSRPDETKEFGPDNFFWKEKAIAIGRGETEKEFRARYQREYRKLYPERVKKYEMKRYFGLPEGAYEKMQEAQKGLCAICKQPETARDSKKQLRSLSLDHCHSTNKVRGLLCTRCNQGLGQFRDNPAYLQAAIHYLESHDGLEKANDG